MTKLYPLTSKILLLCLCMLSFRAYPQSARPVSGKVTSTDESAGLPGVNVLEKGTSKGTVKNTDATGSVATVDSRSFNKGVVNSPQELLMGKTAGVLVTSNSGAPGNTSTIRIRGGSSLSANNDPLIIIDGVPVTNNGLG